MYFRHSNERILIPMSQQWNFWEYAYVGFVGSLNILKLNQLKKIIKNIITVVKENIYKSLHREPMITHRRLKFIPNVVLNLISFFITFLVVGSFLYLLLRYLIMKFYHLD